MPKNKKAAKRVEGETQPAAERKTYIRVRATEQGYYGDMLRNGGEVFLMDVSTLKKMADVIPEEIEDTNPITVGDTDYDLPSWVEVVSGDVNPADEVAKGHPRSHSKENVI